VSRFVQAVDSAMQERASTRLLKVDAFLAGVSWDETFRRMKLAIERVIESRLEIERDSGEAAAG
jgi:hypothetical protein